MDRDAFANDLLSNVCQRLEAAIGFRPDLVSSTSSLAVMINNLGAVSQAEMLIVSNAVASFLYSRRGTILNGYNRPVQLFVGHYITSLQMYGISVSIFLLPNNNGDLFNRLLQAPTTCTSWTPGFTLQPPEKRTVIPIAGFQFEGGPSSRHIDGSGLSQATEKNILAVTDALLSRCSEFAAIDQKTGDGDFGDTGKLHEIIILPLNIGQYRANGNNAFNTDLHGNITASQCATLQ